MSVQVESFCTSNMSSGTALQQDFVFCKMGSKHLIMNILAAVHFASYFSFAVIMSEINHNSISACHFPDDGFLGAVRDLVESARDHMLVEGLEADFSI